MFSRRAGRAKETEGIHLLRLLWHWSQLWMLLVKSHHMCGKKTHCSCRKVLHTGCAGQWKVVLQGKKGLGLKFILKLLSHETHLSFGFGIVMAKEQRCSLTLSLPTLHFNPSSDMWISSAHCLSPPKHLHKRTQVGNGHQGNSSCSCRAT